MTRNGVHLVAFDLGGVLVRLCRSWEHGCDVAGVQYRGQRDAPDAVEGRRAAIREYDVGRIESAEFYRRVSETTGGLYSPQEVERIHLAWLLEEYPGVDRVVDALSAAGLETGILSNTNESHWRQITEAGDRGPRFPTCMRVRHRHASHLLQASKPSPTAFRIFESLAGRNSREILFFDDLAENVEAARAAGWAAERIDPAGDTAAQILTVLRSRELL